jgi:hypothetical protein
MSGAEITNRVTPKTGDNSDIFGRLVKGAKAFEDDSELSELKQAHAEIFKGAKAAPEFDPERVLTFIASDETPDRDGDIVRVDGGDIKNFKKNPIFLKQHNVYDPCGRVLVFKKINNADGSPGGKAWQAKVYFPKEIEDCDEVFKMYEHGIYNTVSIRFSYKEVYSPSDPAERKSLGLGPWGVEVRKWEMLELSAVAIPANPNAAIQKSFDDAVKEYLDSAKAEIAAQFANLEKRIAELESNQKVEKAAPQDESVDSLVASIAGKEIKF